MGRSLFLAALVLAVSMPLSAQRGGGHGSAGGHGGFAGHSGGGFAGHAGGGHSFSSAHSGFAPRSFGRASRSFSGRPFPVARLLAAPLPVEAAAIPVWVFVFAPTVSETAFAIIAGDTDAGGATHILAAASILIGGGILIPPTRKHNTIMD